MPAKGCVGARVTISSECIIEYRAPSDTMIAGSHHFSLHHVITFKCTVDFSHQLTDDREHHRASLGMAPCSFPSSPSPPSTAVTLISHCQNPGWFVFESFYVAHREYLVSSFPYSILMSSHSMNHSFFFSSLVNHVIFKYCELWSRHGWASLLNALSSKTMIFQNCFKWWPLSVAPITNSNQPSQVQLGVL